MPFKTLKELDTTEGTVLLFRAGTIGGNDLVLVPQPSADPNDPLRWPRWRKNMAYGCVCAFACTNNISGTVYSDVFVEIAEHFGVSVATASGLISWVILTLGLSNFFWVPAALYFGKRPVFMLACTISFVAAIWAASTNNFKSLQAACVVGAIGGGASEALGAAIINDIYFLHERGRKMAWNMICLAGGSSLGPLIGGFLVQSKGLKWGKWLCAILLGSNLFMMIFFMPETRFKRTQDTSCSGPSSCTAGTGIVDNADNADKSVSAPLDKVDGGSFASHLEKTAGCGETADKPNNIKKIGQDGFVPLDPNIPRRSQLSLLNPWSGTTPNESFFDLMFRPVPLLLYPACLFSAFIYSICLAPTVMVNVLSGLVLIPPPYNFTTGTVGLLNVPGLIGQISGFFLGGYVIDKYSNYRAHRNGGVFQPEERLVVILLPGALVFAGIVLFGFAAQRTMHWAVVFTAYGLISVGLTSVSGISMTYVCDSYFPVAAECLEMINGLKNVVAYGFIQASVPWVQHQGYERAFGTIGGIFAFFILLAIPLVLFGPKIRHYTSTHWRLISWEKVHGL